MPLTIINKPINKIQASAVVLDGTKTGKARTK